MHASCLILSRVAAHVSATEDPESGGGFRERRLLPHTTPHSDSTWAQHTQEKNHPSKNK